VIEDDTQNGVDHVDGNRGPLLIISPYARHLHRTWATRPASQDAHHRAPVAVHGPVDSHYYTQLNVIRTIEQILGITPMNQKDRAAMPMRGAFTDRPDLSPYTTRPNQVALTYGLSQQPTCGSRAAAARSALQAPPQPPAAAATLAEQWQDWSENQRFSGG
jgi:hypothetical protein